MRERLFYKARADDGAMPKASRSNFVFFLCKKHVSINMRERLFYICLMTMSLRTTSQTVIQSYSGQRQEHGTAPSYAYLL